MASKTRRTKIIRKRKLVRKGVKRKAKLRSQGTTKTDKELFGEQFLIVFSRGWAFVELHPLGPI